MFLNIFSVTLSEILSLIFCFIALIRFGKSVVRSHVFSLAVSAFFLRYEKNSSVAVFFFPPPLQAEKTEKKQTPSGIFAHTKTASGRSSVLRTARKKLPHNRDEIFPSASETL